MTLLTLFLTALGLAADCFAVAVSGSIALCNPTRVQVLRTALAFGLAQFLMPILGWAGGKEFIDVVASYDHWVAFGLLALVGIHMLREAFTDGAEGKEACDITRGFRLVLLAVATSIDALAVGLTFAFLQVDILKASSVIGATAFAVTVGGFSIGTRLGALAGRWARVAGGLILIAIGLKTIFEHTVF
jgi:manganese efflux pump family protein